MYQNKCHLSGSQQPLLSYFHDRLEKTSTFGHLLELDLTYGQACAYLSLLLFLRIAPNIKVLRVQRQSYEHVAWAAALVAYPRPRMVRITAVRLELEDRQVSVPISLLLQCPNLTYLTLHLACIPPLTPGYSQALAKLSRLHSIESLRMIAHGYQDDHIRKLLRGSNIPPNVRVLQIENAKFVR